MFYRIDYIEQMGTGINRMRNAAKEADVAEPIFELNDFFKTTFTRTPLQSATSSNRQAIVSDWQAIKTSDRVRLLLTYVEEHSQITTSEAAIILNLSKARSRAILQEMTNSGSIEKVGNNRYTYYVLKRQ